MREEPGEAHDDLDIEITDLGEGKPAGLAPNAFRQFARRHKRPLTALTAGMVALAVLLLVVNTPAMRGLANKVLSSPAPTPAGALYPGEDLFFVQADPPWGHLTVDGRGVAPLPVLRVTAPLRLARGHHELVWSAEPFQAQRCILSVPVDYLTDTCVDHTTVRVGTDIDSIVIFSESLSTLSYDRQASLLQAVQQELDARQSTVIVPAGELYALPTSGVCQAVTNEAQCYAVATQPLYATLHFRLDTRSSSGETCLTPEPGCAYLGQNCFTFCGVAASASGIAHVWDALAPVLPLWTFQKQDGSVIESNVPDNALWDVSTGQQADESLIAMQITWQQGAWQVNLPETMNTTIPIGLNPVCEAEQNVLGIQNPPVDSFGEPLYLQWQYASGLVPASGCLGVGVSRVDGGSVKSTINTPPGLAYCLLRFGVLLAVNDEAHHFWPNLPVADAYEQSLAQQLAQGISSNV